MRLAPTLIAAGVALAIAVPREALVWAQDDPAPADDKPASTEPSPAARKAAKKLLAKGFSLIKSGDRYTKRKRDKKAQKNYERALQLFQKAHEILPDPQIYFAIAEAQTRLARFLDAVKSYQRILKEGTKLAEDKRTAAQTKLDENAKHVVVLIVHAEPEGALVMVDGNDVGKAPLDGPIYLPLGRHTLTVSEEGYTPQEITEEMEAGTPIEKTIKLKKIPIVVRKPKPAPKPKPKPKISRKPLVVGATITAGAGLLWTIFGVVALSKHGTFSDQSLPQSERDAAASSGKSFALLADLSMLATLGAGAYTIYYYFKVYKPKKRELERRAGRSAGPRLWISPYAASGGAGVAAGGRF